MLGAFPGLPDGMAGSQANAWLTSRAVTERGAGPERLGLALGALVATLVLGPADARAARPDWPASRWYAWGQVRSLALGGGMLADANGRRMVEVARNFVAGACVGVELVLADDPQNLALRGVASLLPPSGGVAVDAGSSWVKRAVVPGEVLPRVPAPAMGCSADTVVRVLADAVPDTGYGPERSEFRPSGPGTVAIALATYVDETGQPYAGQLGPYAPLGDIDLVSTLSAEIARRRGKPVDLQVVHDGWAALLGARLDHPHTDAAIVLGTAIGSGLDPRLSRGA